MHGRALTRFGIFYVLICAYKVRLRHPQPQSFFLGAARINEGIAVFKFALGF
jgi:hypothetical protein